MFKPTPILCGVLLVLWVLVAGCNPLPPRTKEAYNLEMDEWMGKAPDDLKRAWGLPTREDQLSNGNKLLEYKRFLPMGIATAKCITIFEISSEAKIISYKNFGEACRARPKNKSE